MEPEESAEKIEANPPQPATPAGEGLKWRRNPAWLIGGGLLVVVASVASSVFATSHLATRRAADFEELLASANNRTAEHGTECLAGASRDDDQLDSLARLGVQSRVFVNEKMRISYPDEWTTGLEFNSDVGSGVDLYLGHPDVSVRALVRRQTSDRRVALLPESSGPNAIRRLLMQEFDHQAAELIVARSASGEVTMELSFVGPNDMVYQFVARTPAKFFDEHHRVLLAVARSLEAM